MLQLLTVSKHYQREQKVLDEVSFEIQEGEFAFIVGPSGSGKTTIIKLLIREEIPTSGKIYFDDEDITQYSRDQVYNLRRKVGVIFQDYKLIPELNAYENVAFAMEAAGRSEKDIDETVPYLLDVVGLSHRMDYFPHELSGGEKQRVAIARAMANNPKMLIADEPTGNLDPEAAWDIVQILTKINNWGTTVLMSTHGAEFVNSLHKRVLRIENGKLIRDDFKGSYDNLDDFSLKVITNAEKAEKESEKNVIKSEKDPVIEAKPVENTDSKKIKFNLKKSNNGKLRNKKISKIEETAASTDLTKIDISPEVIEILKNNNIFTVEELVEKGVDGLQKIDGMSQENIMSIADAISNFVEKS